MIRTYSLLKAVQPTWDVHFLALQSSGLANSDLVIQDRLSGENIHVDSFDGTAIIKQKLGHVPGIGGLLRLRNILKNVNYLRPIFWLLNLPFLIYRHRKNRRIIENKICSHDFDAILFDYTKMAHHLVLGRNKRIKKVLNVHNVESDTARQGMLGSNNIVSKTLCWLQWRVYQLYEKHFIPKCDLLLAPCPADADGYRRLAPGIRAVVIPNAVDTNTLKPLPPPEEPSTLIYPGRMDYPPNSQAAYILCNKILPQVSARIPQLQVYVVGKNPPVDLQKLASDRIIVTGFVEDVIPYWRKASVLVVPLTIGGGTRIKILEAMALGRPVVTTAKGCEGLEVVHRKHLLVADDPKEFAECVIEVLKTPHQFDEMVLAARKLVEEKYSFAALAVLLQKALADGCGKDVDGQL